MRRARRVIALAAVAATITITIAPGVPATAGTERPVEVLRLDCAARVADASAAVRCEWSAPAGTEAHDYRLWRADHTADRAREVIFRTDDVGTTSHLDREVRRAQRYTYVVQAVDVDGRLVAQSRAATVGVPGRPSVEVMRLNCAVGADADAVGCTWVAPVSGEAEVVELWRSVDGGARQLVDRFRPSGPNAYRDPVPDGASVIAYAVIARDEDGAIVGRSRAQRVRIPDVVPDRVAVPVDDAVGPVAPVAPVTTRPPTTTTTAPTTTTTTAPTTIATVPTRERPVDTAAATTPVTRVDPVREREGR